MGAQRIQKKGSSHKRSLNLNILKRKRHLFANLLMFGFFLSNFFLVGGGGVEGEKVISCNSVTT